MKVSAVKIKNFRSIGNTLFEVLDIKQHNLIIGKNNAGKSSFIRIIPFIGDLFQNLPQLSSSFALSVHNSLSQVEDIFFDKEKESYLSITFSINHTEKEAFLSGFHDNPQFQAKLFNNQNNTITLVFLLRLAANRNTVDYRLMELKWSDISLIDVSDNVMKDNNGENNERNFSTYYGKFTSPLPEFNYLYVMLSKLQELSTRFRIIKAVRKIGGTSQNDDGNTASRIYGLLDISGERAIDSISSWRSPVNSHKILYQKYRKLNSFISDLLGMEISLIVSEDKKQILIDPVKDDEGIILSYKSWGSSVEELIILIVDILSSPEDSIVALEEPEIHLDPIMQRKLMSFLKENTSHQYFISSHSNVFINSFTNTTSAIYRIYKQDKGTQIIKANEEVLHIVLDELALKASDILQTNGIIWVEGPSDRIYLKKWLALKDPNLKEGIDYSIMFYGGRLLSHLTVHSTDFEETEKTKDFIKLLKLNRNMAIIIDSDRESETAVLNKTKTRIAEEVLKNSDRAMVWITDGREIENYIPGEIYKSLLNIDGMNKYSRISDLDSKYLKVDGANKLTMEMNSDIFQTGTDLNKQVTELVSKIKMWCKESIL